MSAFRHDDINLNMTKPWETPANKSEVQYSLLDKVKGLKYVTSHTADGPLRPDDLVRIDQVFAATRTGSTAKLHNR